MGWSNYYWTLLGRWARPKFRDLVVALPATWRRRSLLFCESRASISRNPVPRMPQPSEELNRKISVPSLLSLSRAPVSACGMRQRSEIARAYLTTAPPHNGIDRRS